MRTTVRSVVAGIIVTALAAPALAQSASIGGSWGLAGVHSSKGAFSGTARIVEHGGNKVKITTTCVTASGERFGWSGTGTRSGSTITLRMKVEAPGLIQEILGLVSKHVRATGTYTISSDGTTITGGWKSDDGRASATEQFSRSPSSTATGVAPSIGLVAVFGGKESHEEVVAAHVVPDAVDTIDLRIRRVPGAPQDASLVVTAPASVALFSDAAATQALPVGQKLANADATIKVRGVTSTAAGETAKISVKLVGADGAELGQDSVRVWVSRSAFLLSGHGDFELGESLKSWLATAKRDAREDPTLVLGKDSKTQKNVYYAVYFFHDEQGASLALSTEGSIVAYHGHSNFGLGYAFKTGNHRISDFYNIADPQCPVNWQYLREEQDHPDLMIDDSEYGDDAATDEFSDPIGVPATVLGRLKNYPTSRYPVSGGFGTRYHLTRGPEGKKWLDHHYGEQDNWRIVVKAGSADMPPKRWAKLLLLSCYSGPYYFDSFGGRGTLFFTWDEALCASEAASLFLREQMQGYTDDRVLKDMNKVQNVHDYHVFDPQ
jgi:hypothetical protein